MSYREIMLERKGLSSDEIARDNVPSRRAKDLSREYAREKEPSRREKELSRECSRDNTSYIDIKNIVYILHRSYCYY